MIKKWNQFLFQNLIINKEKTLITDHMHLNLSLIIPENIRTPAAIFCKIKTKISYFKLLKNSNGNDTVFARSKILLSRGKKEDTKLYHRDVHCKGH